jgi:SAM-dependent methyltransferase
METMREVNVLPDYTLRDQERMESATGYFEWQFAMAERHLGRRVLEVGCGVGNFTQHLIGRELVAGIDVEPQCIANHRRRFAELPNVTSECMDVLSPEFLRLRQYAPSSVACLNVLEHVRDDAQALAHMYAILPAGGTVVLIVPAFQGLYGPIDERLGHYRRYSKRSLARAARDAGFEIRILRYLNSVGFFAWWFNARVLRRTEQSATQIRVFDRLVVPVLSRTERWIEPPLGQSIFTVLVKQEGKADQ